jgi:TetR/AcrR family transcriptional repressor of nem operon
LIQRYTATFLAEVDDIVGCQGTGLAKLRGFVGLFERIPQQSKERAVCLGGMLAAEARTLDPKARRLLRKFYVDTTKRLVAILRAGKKDGTRPLANDPLPFAKLIVSLMEGTLITTRVQGGRRACRATTEVLFSLLGAA